MTNTASRYQLCARCVMDSTAPNLTLDAQGCCNFCTSFLQRSGQIITATDASLKAARDAYFAKVKADGKGKRYDAIIGVSGGVDSSWVLYQAVKHGLRPLAVHMDNGWNSELAQNNIERLVRELNVDLDTHVIDWEEYRALQQSFFDADVIDVELLYDNAMLAVNYRAATKWGVRHILSGSNKATEGMAMPEGWNWLKYDRKNIRSIWRKFGDGRRLRTFPMIGVLDFVYYEYVRRIRWESPLDLFVYNKFDALETLEREIGYKPYPYKHYESVFTRFYQAYILPRKFNVDKRRLHLGTLVVAGQLDRETALRQLQEPAYPSLADQQSDLQYFLKKLGWSEEQLTDYISRPAKPHELYGSERALWDRLKSIGQKLGAVRR